MAFRRIHVFIILEWLVWAVAMALFAKDTSDCVNLSSSSYSYYYSSSTSKDEFIKLCLKASRWFWFTIIFNFGMLLPLTIVSSMTRVAHQSGWSAVFAATSVLYIVCIDTLLRPSGINGTSVGELVCCCALAILSTTMAFMVGLDREPVARYDNAPQAQFAAPSSQLPVGMMTPKYYP